MQRLVDRLDIQDTLTTYASAIDDGDFATVRGVFADDATAVYDKDSDLLSGGDAVVAWLRAATGNLDWQHHLVSIYGVTIDGDESSALVYLLSHQSVIGTPHQIRMMSSKYRFQLRRVSGQWRISDVRLKVGWYEERDFEQGVVDLRPDTETELS